MVIPLLGTLADDRSVSSDDDNVGILSIAMTLIWNSISIEQNTGYHRLMIGILGLNIPTEVFPSLCFADCIRGGSLVRSTAI